MKENATIKLYKQGGSGIGGMAVSGRKTERRADMELDIRY